MQFITDQDKQLRIVHIGEERFPVYATLGEVNGEKHWRVVMAVFLLPEAFNTLAGALHPIAANKYSGFWVIPDTKFHAEKAPGITPQFYAKIITQPDRRKRNTGLKTSEIIEEVRRADPNFKPADDFIKDLWNRTNCCELTTLRLIWLAICQEMPRWLMRTHKPIDLGWGKIWALPYRANWKQIMLGKFPNIMAFLRLVKATRNANLEITNFKDEMTSTDMAALVKSGQNLRAARWTIELDPNNLWWEYVDGVEKSVLEGTTKNAYLLRYAALLHRTYPYAVEIFRRWVEQTTLPSAAIRVRRGDNRKELMDYVHPGKVQPCNPEGEPVCVTTDRRTVAIRDSSTGRLVALTPGELQKVPVVDFDARDVWNAGGNHDASDDSGGPATGMLVQHETGGEAPEESLLGAGEQSHNGVAGQPDA